jgi:hypothetical protein
MTQIEQERPSSASSASAAPPTASFARIAAVFVLIFGATALLVRCVAVATQSPGGHAGHDPAVAARDGQPLTLEQLGARVGCKPKIQTNATELRQGYCSTTLGRFFLTTFATGQGQLEWVEMAKDYGLVLIGNRWTASGAPDVLRKLQTKLGGGIYGTSHSGHG